MLKYHSYKMKFSLGWYEKLKKEKNIFFSFRAHQRLDSSFAIDAWRGISTEDMQIGNGNNCFSHNRFMECDFDVNLLRMHRCNTSSPTNLFICRLHDRFDKTINNLVRLNEFCIWNAIVNRTMHFKCEHTDFVTETSQSQYFRSSKCNIFDSTSWHSSTSSMRAIRKRCAPNSHEKIGSLSIHEHFTRSWLRMIL